MTTPWRVRGSFFEACNCDFVCPCITDARAVPTRGDCVFALAFTITTGHLDDVSLDGVPFVVVGRTPGVMALGGWALGLIVDDDNSSQQNGAIRKIVQGQVGGPFLRLAPLVSQFMGVEHGDISIEEEGRHRSVHVPGRVTEEIKGVRGASATEPIYIDNAPHPFSAKVAVARAIQIHISAFGLEFHGASGNNNGHFGKFDWTASWGMVEAPANR